MTHNLAIATIALIVLLGCGALVGRMLLTDDGWAFLIGDDGE